MHGCEYASLKLILVLPAEGWQDTPAENSMPGQDYDFQLEAGEKQVSLLYLPNSRTKIWVSLSSSSMPGRTTGQRRELGALAWTPHWGNPQDPMNWPSSTTVYLQGAGALKSNTSARVPRCIHSILLNTSQAAAPSSSLSSSYVPSYPPSRT